MRELAEKLWRARENGTVVPEGEGRTALSTNDDAYALQSHIIDIAGHPIVGYKVGSTSVEAQKKLGTDEPGSCPVLSPFLHESPARLSISADQGPAVEGEFAFRLGHDLPARDGDYAMDEVRAAVAAIAPSVEVVGSRFAGGLGGKGRLLVTGDCGANMHLVVGAFESDWTSLDIPAHAVTMKINGETRETGTGARALGDPLNVLLWLANKQSSRGLGLKAGDVIATGTCTGLVAVQSGDDLVCDFGTLGKVEIAFE